MDTKARYFNHDIFACFLPCALFMNAIDFMGVSYGQVDDANGRMLRAY